MAPVNERIPVLLDTDIGSDIDDALCLAYLLRQPRCELVGITTVSGEPQRRAMLADATCQAGGRTDIPIHSGTEAPLLGPQHQPEAQQAEVLPRWPHRSEFTPNTAVDFLRQTIRNRPGEITLLTIGPLTNIALLFRLDPEIPRLLKSLVIMGGAFFLPKGHGARPAEWNILCDPHAAAIVYGAAESLSVGLDVTTQCFLPASECRQRLRGGALDVVAEAAEVWFRHRQVITFHDPLAAAAIFAPDLMGYQPGRVEVELQSDKLRGATLWDSHAPQPCHRIAASVNPEAFFAEYFRTVKG